MNGPSGGPTPGYLARVNAAMAPAQNPDPFGLMGAPAPAAPPAGPVVLSAPPPVGPPMAPDVARIPSAPLMSAGMLPVMSPSDMAASMAPPPTPPPGLVQFGAPVMGGSSPEHEARTKGPIVTRLEDRNIQRQVQLADQQADRTMAFHDFEAQKAQEDVDRDKVYENARIQAQAANDHEAKQTQQRFTQAVEETAAKGAIDPDRLYNSKTTGQKIAQNVFVLLGGLFGGLSGQENKALAVVEREQDRDIAAQKFSYQAGLDQAAGRKSAFGTLMDRLGNEQAAEHALRAAMLQRQMDEARVMKAKASTVEEANNYDKAIGAFRDRQSREHVAGLQFMQARQGGARYAVTDARGQTIYVDEATRNKMFQEGVATEAKLVGGNEDNRTKLQLAEMENRAGGSKAAAQAEIHAHHVQEGAEKLSTRLAGMAPVLAAADEATKQITEHPRSFAERAARTYGHPGVPFVLPDDVKIREAAYGAVVNKAMKLQFGNVVASEEARAAIEFANKPDATDAERKQAVERIKKAIKLEMTSAYAGATPEVQSQYRTNAEAAPALGAQPGAGVTSFQPSAPPKK